MHQNCSDWRLEDAQHGCWQMTSDPLQGCVLLITEPFLLTTHLTAPYQSQAHSFHNDLLLGICTKEFKQCTQKYLYNSFCCSRIYNSPDLEATKMILGKWRKEV